MLATNEQQIILQKYAATPPSNLGELREYAETKAAVSRDGTADVYALIAVLIDRIQANLQLVLPPEAEDKDHAKES